MNVCQYFSFSFFTLPARIGFVIQEDVLYPQLTVEETLVFSALLRLPTNMSKQQKYAKVNTTIKELGLERCVLNHISYVHVRIKHKLLQMKGIKMFLQIMSCITIDAATQK